jgi:hypothetical protein
MRTRRLLISVLALLPLLSTSLPASAWAGNADTIRRALAKQPFKDLPGVKLPQATDDEPKTVCTSRIGRDSWDNGRSRTGYVPRLSRRIYSCDVDNVTIESTKRPDEVDWKKQKRYYKPWIDDGFDRDR